MFGPFIFGPLLLAVCVYAWLRGGADERVVAATCLAGTLATMLAISPLRQRYAGVEEGLLLVDLAVLAGFITVALRSKRFWPLWVAGLQLTLRSAISSKALTRICCREPMAPLSNSGAIRSSSSSRSAHIAATSGSASSGLARVTRAD